VARNNIERSKDMNAQALILNLKKNTLEDAESNIHRLEYENYYFTVKIIYNGDYINDKINKAIDRDNLKVMSKSKSPLYSPSMGYANENITVTIPALTLFDEEQISIFNEKYMATVETKSKLEEIIDKYF
jgi:hypothetical protein